MTSNSKLTQEQKADRKEMMDALPKGSTFAVSECGVTVLAVPEGDLVAFSSAVMSEDEQKFRRKVGEYHALARYFAAECIILPAAIMPDAGAFVIAIFGAEWVSE